MQIISTKEAFHGHRFQNEVISTELDFEFIIITYIPTVEGRSLDTLTRQGG